MARREPAKDGLNSRITYMLRRTLSPWKLDETIAEAVEFCQRNLVDEIMWISESHARYRELPPLPTVEELVANLRVAKARGEAAGILYSINPLTTLGHGDYGGDGAKTHPGMEFMVDYKGGRAKFCPCPLSPVWRDLITRTYALYASTRPVRLWMEDDFRYFGHGPSVSFGCYCDRHMAEFGRRIGRTIGREELVGAILRPGEPDPLRAAWLEFLEWSLADAAGMVARAVHEVSPETRLSWMSSTPAIHELEGRRPDVQIRAFMDGGETAIRMSTTHYHENSPRDMLVQDEALKKMTIHLPAKVKKCTEIESMPHGLYAKSAERIAAQMAWGCVVNVPNQTLNIFDFIGSPLSETPLFADMLRTRKPALDQLARCFAEVPRPRGIAIPSHPQVGRFVRTKAGADMTELMARDGGWADPLRAFGMSVVWGAEEAVTAVTGEGLRGYTEQELRALFGRGVLLDLSAARTLADMGLASLAGVTPGETIPFRTRETGEEELTDPEFGGAPRRYTWGYGMSVGALALGAGARAISRVMDTRERVLAPGITLFENELGGRVATVPYDCCGTSLDTYQKGPSIFFYSEARKEQMRAVARWLGRGLPPLTVEANGWTLPHRADGPGLVALAAMNINYDAWPGVGMTCGVDKPVRRVRWLRTNGRWATLTGTAWRQSGAELRLRVDTPVPTHGVLAVAVELEK